MKKFPLVIFVINLFAFAVFSQLSAEQHLKKSRELQNAGKIEEAITEITIAIKIEPNNPALYLKRANLARFSNNADLLESDLLKVIALTPDNYQNQQTAVRFLIDNEKCPTALKIINASIQHNPANADAYYWRAGVKNCLEDFESALEDNAKAVSLDPLNEMYKAGRANLLARQKKPDKAVESYDDLITAQELKLKVAGDSEEINKIKRHLSTLYISRSKVYASQNKVEAAFSDLNRAIEILPAVHTYEMRARAFRWQKQFDRAIDDYSAAIKLQPEDQGLFLSRGDIYASTDKYDQAMNDYQKVASGGGRMKEIADQKINSIKQKMQENLKQPK
ncbi:MAG: domain protein component of TonB system [Acidobacteria bacterium]|jgi:tetratricopeptide (TPR) repeat protein|nr:domain protein component of TonB system [Acidobacteriota bacterium]